MPTHRIWTDQQGTPPKGVFLCLQGGDFACGFLEEDVDIHGLTLRKFHELIDRREEYWGSGTPGGQVYFAEVVADGQSTEKLYRRCSPELLVDYHQNHGFMFQLIEQQPNGDLQYWISINRNSSPPFSSVEFVCQTSFWFPSTAFVDTATAKKVAATFTRTKGGSRSRFVAWRKQDGGFSDPNSWKQFVPN